MDAIEQLKTLRLSEHSQRGYGYPEAQIYHVENEVALDMAIEALEKLNGLERYLSEASLAEWQERSKCTEVADMYYHEGRATAYSTVKYLLEMKQEVDNED